MGGGDGDEGRQNNTGESILVLKIVSAKAYND